MILETSTAWWIPKSDIIDKKRIDYLKSILSVIDYMTEAEVPTAYFERGDMITIPKIRKVTLEHALNQKVISNIFETPISPVDIYYDKMKITPLPHQVDIIKDAVDHLLYNGDKRVCICAKPGFGKTYVSAAIVHQLNAKFIFIVNSAQLVQQTYDSYVRYLGKDGIYILKSSSQFETIEWENIRGIMLTHTMIQSLCKNYGTAKVAEAFLGRMRAAVKIIDEYDRFVGNLYHLETWTTFKYNMYLTGTKYKNLKPDDRIFQSIYKPVKTIGDDVELENKRHSIRIQYKFSPSPKEYTKINAFGGKVFKIRYNDFLARKDILLDYIMKTFYKPEDSILRSITNSGEAVVIYVGRIDNCEIVKKKLINNFGINEDDIGIYNSEISLSNKKIAETKKWIITTTESMGRGYDNKRLRALIFLEFNFGLSTYTQNVSRVARVGGKDGYVFEGIDLSFSKIKMHYRSKCKKGIYEDLFKDSNVYTIPENYYKYYVYGYRPDSDFAKEILEKKKKNKRR